MAMHCDKCGGIIPDLMVGNKKRHNCDNHIKPEINIPPLKKGEQ